MNHIRLAANLKPAAELIERIFCKPAVLFRRNDFIGVAQFFANLVFVISANGISQQQDPDFSIRIITAACFAEQFRSKTRVIPAAASLQRRAIRSAGEFDKFIAQFIADGVIGKRVQHGGESIAVGADGTTFRSGKFPDFIRGSAVRTGKLFCFHYAGSFFISCDKTKYSPVFRECKLYRLIFRKKRLYYLQISERNSADECKRTDEERKNLLLHR